MAKCGKPGTANSSVCPQWPLRQYSRLDQVVAVTLAVLHSRRRRDAVLERSRRLQPPEMRMAITTLAREL
jgi:hypothetical protein